MHIFQSSAFKLACALVVPALLANAIPQTYDKQASTEKVFLTLYGNKKGDLSSDMDFYPKVELIPSSSGAGIPQADYNVVGKWTGDGKNIEGVSAIRDTDQTSWDQTVQDNKRHMTLLAAGYDNEDPKGWWTISGGFLGKSR